MPDTIEVRCQALALILPSTAAFSHETSAALTNLPLPSKDSAIHVKVRPGVVVPNINEVVGHTGLSSDDVITQGDLRLVSPARTFFDLAPQLTLKDLVILGDAIVRRWSTVDDLRQMAAQLKGHRGIVRARKAVASVRPGVDSPMETITRLLIQSAGLPEPTINVNVCDEGGGWLARPDLSYPELKIAIEYDGDHHRTDKNQWRKDRGRDEVMRDAGWIVIILTADDVLRYPKRTIDRIRSTIEKRSNVIMAK